MMKDLRFDSTVIEDFPPPLLGLHQAVSSSSICILYALSIEIPLFHYVRNQYSIYRGCDE